MLVIAYANIYEKRRAGLYNPTFSSNGTEMVRLRYLFLRVRRILRFGRMGVAKKTAAVRQKYRNGTIDKIIKNNRGVK